jgi:hypothetical protein
MTKKKKAYSFKSLDPIKPTIAYDTYWTFACKRQDVFVKRLRGEAANLTDDEIIKTYKFTNAYRACDRVSQYLIKHVIYSECFGTKDMFLRILLFKLFNRIDTWKLLEEKFGTICTENFSVKKYSNFLDSEMNKGRVLYSNAYMMASGSKEFDVTRKHHAHFMLLEKMLKNALPNKIEQSATMAEAYHHILAYPLIGQFLAYQYVTDINYSEITDFSESEFTVPGPGARDGIRKCFASLGGVSESELIKILAERQDYEFDRLGLSFKTLGGRKLQYIDIQNIFCETDKYCRIAHPEMIGISGRTKIKQLFKINDEPIDYFFPPKWEVDPGNLYGAR